MPSLEFLSNAGEMGALVRAHDWSKSPLGEPSAWSQPLRTLVGVMMGSNQPMFLAWGPERTLVYNDAYAAILAGKHPDALGRPFLEVWHEIRDDLLPIVEQAYAGEPVQMDDIMLIMERRGYPEETHFSFSYTPVRSDDGAIEGFFCACQEITAQVMAERRLAVERDRLRLMFSQAPGLMALLNGSDHVFEMVNPGLEALFGHRPLIGRPVREALPEIAAQGFEEILNEVFRSGEPFLGNAVRIEVESQGDEADPAERFFDFVYQPLTDEDGRVIGIFAEGQEVTKRVRAEARAREEAMRVQLALDAGAIIGTWVWDLRTGIFTVDEQFAQSFGLDPSRAREGVDLALLMESVHPEDRPGLQAAIDEATGRGGSYAHRYRVRHRDGEYHWIEANGRVDVDPDGAAMLFPGVLLDVEERQRTETRLSEANRRLDAILNNTREAVFLMDHHQQCVYANAAAEKLTGYSFEQMRGRPLHDVVHHKKPDGSHYPIDECPIDRAFPERAQMSGEELFVAPDGSFYPVAFTASPVLNDDGKPVGTVIEARNIAEEKARSDALRASQEHLATVYAQTAVGLPETDLEGRFLAVNDAYCRIVGRPREELLGGLRMQDITHPDDLARNLEMFHRCTTTGEPFAIEKRYLRPDGSLVWVYNSVGALRGTDGRPRSLLAATVDVTERRAAEVALRESEARFRNMADHAPVMMWVTRPDGYCTYLNRQWYEFTGQSPEDAEGFGWLEATHPDDKPEAERVFLDANARQVPFRLEYRLRRADGQYRWAIDAAAPRFGAGGEFMGYIGSVIDIHERRDVEDRLRESEERYRTLFERIASGFCIAEVRQDGGDGRFDYRVVEANPAFFDQTGFPEAILGQWLRDAAPGLEEHWFEAYGRVARTGESLRFEQGSALLDRWFDVYSFRVGEPTEWRIGILFNDISARRKAEEALRDLNETLEGRVAAAIAEREQAEEALRQSQKMEAVGQLTGGIAHDFNNLLAGISGSLDMIETRVAQGRLGEVGRYVLAAQGAAKRAASLTHRLLAFSRRQTLEPKPTDVNRLVVGMEELIRRTVGPSIEVENVAQVGLWTTFVDPHQLENALLNLCINARDALPNGGKIVIETANRWLDERASVGRELRPGQYVSLCVSDNGTGMSPEVVARAFEPFFTTKPIGQGTGLGLSMIYGFVRQSGGQVRIYSEEGQGTMVCLYLPRHHGGEATESAALAETATEPACEGETVLVIDDEPVVRMLVTDVLEELGYKAIEAGDGPEGLKVLRSDARVDLLITDVGLPGGMNGRQVADAARDLRPGLNVLFVTGYAENAVLNHGHLEPGMQVVTKPFDMDRLVRSIRDLISAR